MGRLIYILVGKRKSQIMYLKVYSTRQKAEIQREVFEQYDRDTKDYDWTYQILEERVWD